MKTKAQLEELFSSLNIGSSLITYIIEHFGEDEIERIIKEVKEGTPIQYAIGNVNFYGSEIQVNPSVLIPRFETEELCYKTIQRIKEHFQGPIELVDIGTGSGCIAITMKKELPNSQVTAVDISKEALETAIQNGIKNEVEIEWLKGDLLAPLTHRYDCIISNPPYIGSTEEVMEIVKKKEPHLALYAKEEGYENYIKILKDAKKYVKERYLLAFEIGNTQGKRLQEIAKTYFEEADIIVEQDMEGKDRFLFITSK